MATITITPGNTFNPTETVTSTKLNDLGSPTAALTTGSIVPTDLSTGAPSWDGSGTFNVIGSLSSSSIFTSGEAIEINQSGTGDRNAYIDFHTADPSGTDFNARIFRHPGVNADLEIINSGTGAVVISSSIAQINSNSNSIATKAYVDEGGGFTPSTYIGTESVTLPNGLIMKMGTVAIAGNTTNTVIFDTNLDVFTGTVNAQVTPIEDDQIDINQPLKVGSLSNTQLVIRNTSPWTGNAYWQVIGY